MNSRLCLIANGFQEDYIINYLASLSGKFDQIDFIGSSIYLKEKIHSSINFYDLQGGGVQNQPLAKRVKRVIIYYFSLLRFFLRKPRRGIIHIQWLRFKILDGIIFPLIFKLLGYKIIYTVHDIVPHDRDTAFNRMVFKIIYKINWKLIVHTEFIKTRLSREFGIEEKKIGLIHHGVYDIKDKNLILDKQDAKIKLGINPDTLLILFFGYITRYKGLDLLLEAFASINAASNVHLIIAGRVYDNYKQALDELQIKYKANNIQFIIRRIEEEELPVLFGAADLTALPYREASQSGVLFMSYAYGVPVIAPDIGGFPHDVIDGKTGLIFRSENVTSLKEKFEEFILRRRNNPLYSKKEIRDYARENYSWEKSANDLVNFLKV